MSPGSSINPLVITAGEPAGIGPELCLALADTHWADQLVVVADAEMLAQRATEIGKSVRITAYEAYSSESGARTREKRLKQLKNVYKELIKRINYCLST